jgi:hypothetical protein
MLCSHYTYIFIVTTSCIPPDIQEVGNVIRIYWCVAYLPSEASIIEH